MFVFVPGCKGTFLVKLCKLPAVIGDYRIPRTQSRLGMERASIDPTFLSCFEACPGAEPRLRTANSKLFSV